MIRGRLYGLRKKITAWAFTKEPKIHKTLKEQGFDKPEEAVTVPTRIKKTNWQDLMQILIIVGFLGLVISVYMLWNNPLITQDNPTPEELEQGNQQRNAGVLALLLLGSAGFLPIGLILGWLIMDPFQRARVMRTMFKKNYGIVNFVSRGGKIIAKVKNFDMDLLFTNDGVWVLNPNRVFRLAKSGEGTEEEASNPISEKHITTVMGIPNLFLSIDTMEPLTFDKDEGGPNPIDLASTMKGYIMNQLAKNMFFKKTFTAVSILSIVLIIVDVYFTWEIYNVMMEIKDLLPQLKSLASNSGQIVQTITQGGG